MPFPRPSLSDLRGQANKDMVAALGLGGVFLRRSLLGTICQVFAGFIHLLYGYLDWISLQAVPYTATGEYLEGWAALKNVTRNAATPWLGTVTATGLAGTVIASGAVLTRPSDGAAYATTGSAVIGSGGTATLTVTASAAGSAGNLVTGATLAFALSVAGLTQAATVVATTTGGTDTETDSSLRTRMLQRYQNPPQGGDPADYVGWALAVPGVTRAWCEPLGFGPGTVLVWFMMDVTESAFGGYPQGTNGVAAAEARDTAATGDQLTVANALYGLRPVTAIVYTAAPTPSPVNFSISGVVVGSQAAVRAAIAAVLMAEGAPDGVTAVSLADIEAAVRAISPLGLVTAPAANITVALGALPSVGTITWS